MALRTFTKMYKASYDLQTAIKAVGDNANRLATFDADRRSTQTPASLGMTSSRFNLERRRAASAYVKSVRRARQLLGKFDRYDATVIARIDTLNANGKANGARKGSKRGRKSSRGRGRPKGSKNKAKN